MATYCPACSKVSYGNTKHVCSCEQIVCEVIPSLAYATENLVVLRMPDEVINALLSRDQLVLTYSRGYRDFFVVAPKPRDFN